MLVWRGWGFPLLVLLLAPMLILQESIQATVGDSILQGNLPLYDGLGILVGGLIVLFVRLRFLEEEPRELLDTKTGATVILKAHHDVFWIDIKWWSIAAIAGGATSSLWGIIVPYFR